MTQPPPPPNQPPNDPPQGGFGAPQDPPPQQPGFGAPQGPPQTPPPASPPGLGKDSGYGYPQAPPPAQPPQAPPAPPAGQPDYGYPQAPPPGAPGQQPYGYPQTPPGGPAQGGYGYPGQQQPQYGGYQQPPTMPMGAQGAGAGGRKMNTQMTIIVAAVVAIALIVGGGVWYASSSGDTQAGSSSGGTGEGKGGGGEAPAGSGGDEKVPSDPGSKVLFQVPSPEIKGDDSFSVKGAFLTDKIFAKPGINEIVGYDVNSGEEVWTLPLDGSHCASSPEIGKGNIGAVVMQEKKVTKEDKYHPCSKVAAIDLDTGDRLWTEQVGNTGQEASFDEVSISGNTVAAGAGTDGGAAFDLKSGDVLWEPQPTDSCEDAGYAGGKALVAVRKCGNYDDPKLEVQLLDPTSGKPEWSYPLADGIDNAKVISTDPVVFGTDTKEITSSGATDVFALDAQGKLRSRIPLEDGKYSHDCDVNKVHSCQQIVVGNDKVYVPTEQHDAGGSESGRVNEIVSFSLKTGKSGGDRADSGVNSNLYPLRMDGKNVLAYKSGPYDKGGQIVTLDQATMKETVLLENPATESVRRVERNFLPEFGEVLYSEGRLVMSALYARKPSSADEKEYLAIAFGLK